MYCKVCVVVKREREGEEGKREEGGGREREGEGEREERERAGERGKEGERGFLYCASIECIIITQ